MKVVMTLLARDEADILDHQLRYHLEHGVDFVVATDHRSVDGTNEILRRYEREGHLHLIRETDGQRRQVEWVTRMARLAATDFGADWVINSDSDEFWWSRDGTLREVLAAVPPRFGAIRGVWRHFVPRPTAGEPFHERMIVRRPPLPDLASPYHPQVKALHRAAPDVVVAKGNHDVRGRGLTVVRGWYPIDVLHFPIRTLEQMERKFRAKEPEVDDPGEIVGRHVEAGVKALRAGDAEGFFRAQLVDDDTLAAGLSQGVLAIDTRLRDALRFRPEARAPAPNHLSLDERIRLAEELDTLRSHDAVVRLTGRFEAFERRLSRVEAVTALTPGGVLERTIGFLRRSR